MTKGIEINEEIYLEAPFEIQGLTELNISNQVDDHACMHLVGTASEKEEENILGMDENTRICLFITTKGKKNLIFCGMPVDMSYDHGEKREFKVKVAANSIAMDWEKKSRSFQKGGISWSDVVSNVVREYNGDFLLRSSKQKSYEYPLIQNQETDWEFLKRIGRSMGQSIYGTAQDKDIKLYMGVHGDDNVDLSMKYADKSIIFARNKKGTLKEVQMHEYTIESRESYYLGQSVTYDEKKYIIVRAEGELQHGQFIFRYQLRKLESCAPKMEQEVLQYKNRGILGTVIAVKQNRVKLHLDIDEDQKEEEAHWYPWYRNDWFCMPQLGAKVLLFLPDANEEKAYVLSVNQKKNEKTQQPERKCMETEDQKGWYMEESSMTLFALEGETYLELSACEGIMVNSNKKLNFTGQDIQIESARISLKSREQIVLHTKRNSIVMDDLIQMKG